LTTSTVGYPGDSWASCLRHGADINAQPGTVGLMHNQLTKSEMPLSLEHLIGREQISTPNSKFDNEPQTQLQNDRQYCRFY